MLASIPKTHMLSPKRSERIEDHGNVDHLLEDRAFDGLQISERSRDHRPDRKRQSSRYALKRIRRLRRAIATALARGPSSSTRSTTPAASDDEAAPRAPMATPISAAASAGASLTPSPERAGWQGPPALRPSRQDLSNEDHAITGRARSEVHPMRPRPGSYWNAAATRLASLGTLCRLRWQEAG